MNISRKGNVAIVNRFSVRILFEGQSYGLDNCLTHKGDVPLIEFYDNAQDKTKFGELGQFISRYSLLTIKDIPEGRSLALMGGTPDWNVSGEEMKYIVASVKDIAYFNCPVDILPPLKQRL
jgi:hypothetical protein